MRKFKCEVVTTNTYIVEIDENIINEDWMDNYSNYFTEIDTIEEHAINVAWHRNMFKNDNFEGYGYVGEVSSELTSEDLKNKGITLRVISEDEEIETEAREIK
ncbi:hypothetical protein BSK59_13725 [Paenibacillus odorifer]|uniref:hypothetical protein n=1 Tax=Paenibacillus odorifer TaxID=189426 RepID=UPI00096EC9F5|nr:hypothetical protein [Paenibacillus odorifer]OME55530.1 hypothetical protein BSK59_13725 [Paenibacillus odorifer]